LRLLSLRSLLRSIEHEEYRLRHHTSDQEKERDSFHLANVKDEPRRDLARLVPHHAFHSTVSFRKHIPSHEA